MIIVLLLFFNKIFEGYGALLADRLQKKSFLSFNVAIKGERRMTRDMETEALTPPSVSCDSVPQPVYNFC